MQVDPVAVLKRFRVPTFVVMTLALMATTAAAETKRDPCSTRSGMTLAANTNWRIIRPNIGSKIYACERHGEQQTRFVTYDDLEGSANAFRLRRDIVAYATGTCDRHYGGQCQNRIVDLNMRTGTRRVSTMLDGSVTTIKLTARRRYAAIVQRDTGEPTSVVARGERSALMVLDEGLDVDPAFLRISSDMLRWRRAGIEKSASLPR